MDGVNHTSDTGRPTRGPVRSGISRPTDPTRAVAESCWDTSLFPAKVPRFPYSVDETAVCWVGSVR